MSDRKAVLCGYYAETFFKGSSTVSLNDLTKDIIWSASASSNIPSTPS